MLGRGYIGDTHTLDAPAPDRADLAAVVVVVSWPLLALGRVGLA